MVTSSHTTPDDSENSDCHCFVANENGHITVNPQRVSQAGMVLQKKKKMIWLDA